MRPAPPQASNPFIARRLDRWCTHKNRNNTEDKARKIMFSNSFCFDATPVMTNAVPHTSPEQNIPNDNTFILCNKQVFDVVLISIFMIL